MNSLTDKSAMITLHERHEDIPAAFNLPEDAAKLRRFVVREGSFVARHVRAFVLYVVPT